VKYYNASAFHGFAADARHVMLINLSADVLSRENVLLNHLLLIHGASLTGVKQKIAGQFMCLFSCPMEEEIH
jgi:hypothetical protein